MEILLTHTQVPPFIKEYKKFSKQFFSLYDYSCVDERSVLERTANIREMQSKHPLLVDRGALSETIRSYIQRLSESIEMKQNENLQLISQGAFTVVTGQQAGLFTGPLLTINKIISVLKACDTYSVRLEQPIVPIFWIAGEDHDIDEIDHTYFITQKAISRITIPWNTEKPKVSVSQVQLSNDQIDGLIAQVKVTLPDSIYKKEVISVLTQAYSEQSVVVAFAKLIQRMFGKYGVLIFDSHDLSVRKLEVPILQSMIQRSSELQSAFLKSKRVFTSLGYEPQVKQEDQATGLFINYCNKRRAIRYSQDRYSIKGIEATYDVKDMFEWVANEPERFSTNVLLRPIMQELLFQPIAYIGGNAEIMYWGQMKSTFALFELRMPIILARNSYTYIAEQLRSKIVQHGITEQEILLDTSMHRKDELLQSYINKDFSLELHIEAFKNEWYDLNKKYLNKMPDQLFSNAQLEQIYGTHEQRVLRLMDTMKQQLLQLAEQKHHHMKDDLDLIWNVVLPKGSLQERAINVYTMINAYGEQWIHQLLNLPHPCNGEHYLVTL
ncbi:bacillithiol biosynthesis cysteine-adding enzyme BshC [Desulfuribacillus stibiiarsenatis]|uniref:Putative cysteine ligase BshC n=1 Tax=Desulfuribacillus stibiiarsenatis TaxID=1390249 RepID=A0A1E5L3N8_9FIRM|nr:bacillithiol biosynthesis cysteine-adding enzyme BshC [Desulfuribacillus stibiiarsenatis]OEH84701.1 bacillithiol biosynthesis cysteine-adding enzyme BshC [Desulfuribacillus stibiiarsenatis]